MESKVDRDVVERVCRKIQFANLHVVPHHNRGGGLALLWKGEISVDVLTSSK